MQSHTAAPIPYKPVYPRASELDGMTEQDVFDRVAVHLLKQGKRSTTPDPALEQGDCRYRGDDGTACAVGVLIPESLYAAGFEGRTVYGVGQVAEGTPLGELVKRHKGLLRYLQRVHDECTPGLWRCRLREVADGRGLATAAIDAIHN